MHDDTSQMWRVTRVTFKYHSTLGNLIGVPTTHLNSCPCILLSEITFRTVSVCRLDWLYFFLCSFTLFDRALQSSCLFFVFFPLDLTNTVGVLYSDISALFYIGYVIGLLQHHDISSGSEELCAMST